MYDRKVFNHSLVVKIVSLSVIINKNNNNNKKNYEMFCLQHCSC